MKRFTHILPFSGTKRARGRVLAIMFPLLMLLALALPAAAQETVTISLGVPEFFADIYENQIIPEFEAQNPNIDVHLVKLNSFGVPVLASAEPEVYLEEFANYVRESDVVLLDQNVTSAATRAGMLLDLSPLADSDSDLDSDDFYPGAWDAFRWDGGLWGLPASMDVVLMFYDRAAFDAAGLAYPNASWTTADFDNAIRTLTTFNEDGTINTPGLTVLGDDESLLIASLLGAPLYDETLIPSEPDFSAVDALNLLETWAQLYTDQYLQRTNSFTFSFGANAEEINPLTVGRAALNQSVDASVQLGASLLPGSNAYMIVNGYGVSSGTRHPEAAYELAKFLTQNPTAAQNSFPGLLPARRSLKDAPAAEGGIQLSFAGNVPADVQAVIDQALETALPVNATRFATGIVAALEDMIANGTDASTALTNVENELRERLAYASEQRGQLDTTVNLPEEEQALAPDEIALKFGAESFLRPFPNEDRWNELAAEFAAQDPEVGRVDFEPVLPTAGLDYTEAFDCYYTTTNLVPDADLSTLVNLDPLMASDPDFDRNDFVNGVLDQLRRDNGVWGYPISLQPEALSYDFDIFNQYGIPLPENGWTVSEFENALRDLVGAVEDTKPFSAGGFNTDYLLSLITAYGGIPVDTRGGETVYNFTDPANIEAIRQVLDLVRAELIDYQPFTTGGTFTFGAENASPITTFTVNGLGFGGGGGVVVIGGDGDGDGTQAEDTTRLTTYPGGTDYTAVSYGISAAYVSTQSQNVEACYRFISFVASQIDLIQSMPARLSIIADPLLAASQPADNIAYYNHLVDVLAEPTTLVFPSGINLRNIGNAVPQLWMLRAFDKYVTEDNVDLVLELQDAQNYVNAYQECTSQIEQVEPEGGLLGFAAYFQQFTDCAVQVDPSAAEFFPGFN